MTTRQRLALVGLGLFATGAIIGYTVDRRAGFFVALAGVAIIVFGSVVDTGPDASREVSPEDPELMTAEEVAAKLGVRANWLYTLVARDSIPYVRQGGRWWAPEFRFRWSEVQEWVQCEGRDMLADAKQDAHTDAP